MNDKYSTPASTISKGEEVPRSSRARRADVDREFSKYVASWLVQKPIARLHESDHCRGILRGSGRI